MKNSTLTELRVLISEILKAQKFRDNYFIEKIIPMLKMRKLLPLNMGQLLGFGNEAVVFALGSDQVIRLQPTYELFDDQVEEVLQRMQNAPTGGLYAKIFDVGKIEAYDDDEEKDVAYAIYTIMEKLSALSLDEANIIDDVVTGKVSLDTVKSGPLYDFLKTYLQLPVDHDSNNVMKRDDEYVIIDQE